jgi:hypothetical protein
MSQVSLGDGKSAKSRSLKQKRKDNLRLALAAIKNKVPVEGRNVFKGGSNMSDSDIDPFEDHDALMRKAGNVMIYFCPPEKPAMDDLKHL